MFDEVETHIEAGTLIKEFKMSALPSLYEQFVQLIKFLLDNKHEDRDQVVILFQDMLEVVTRDIVMEDHILNLFPHVKLGLEAQAFPIRTLGLIPVPPYCCAQ
ncbi:Callose synthase 3 [Lathyrus oleraceus]|uniref:Callose synthase 3 n=1 Tax=Pisum sativum TaxID=3888 RepID=A0A9D5B0J4_PEA|nr:Callose synthase 3 [Pisum sativum]